MDKSLVPMSPEAMQDSPQDSMDAIYALNVGDFVLEHFISDDLRQKISDTLGKAPDKLYRQLEELVHLYTLDKTLGVLGGEWLTEHPEALSYNAITTTLVDMFQASACHLFLRQSTSLSAMAEPLILAGTSLPTLAGVAQEVTLQGDQKDLLYESYLGSTPVVLEPTGKDRLNWRPNPLLQQEKTVSLLAAPLLEGRKRTGLLLIEHHEARTFSPELLALAEATVQTLVTGIRMYGLLRDTQYALANEDTANNDLIALRAQITETIADLGLSQQAFVERLAGAIDARYSFTRGHSQGVATIARTIADSMDLNEKTVDLIYFAGLLSTLGKMNLSQEVLEKKENLADHEWTEVRNHPKTSVALLSRIHFLSEVIPYLQSCQERWDGSGGPAGLKGKNIPLGSRILAVADAYHAMVCERPYREAPLSHQEALGQLESESGIKWDPMVIEKLSEISVETLS